jgi:hypothetical protein
VIRRAGDLDAVNQNPIVILARDAGITWHPSMADRQIQSMTLDAHVTAAHRMTENLTALGGHARLTRQPEPGSLGIEVLLVSRQRRQQLLTRCYLNDALFALALSHTGGRDTDGCALGSVEQ